MKRIREHFVTCGQMKILERRADESGLSYYQMMENAGTGAAEIILDRAAYLLENKTDITQNSSRVAEKIISELPENKKESLVRHLEKTKNTVKSPNDNIEIFVFCGKGNNGGDGFVIARLLCEAGRNVKVILVDGEPKTEDALKNFELLRAMPVKIFDMKADDRALMSLKTTPDIIVDAIYGTGFKGKLEGRGLKASIYINKHASGASGKKSMVIAIDIPSGMGGDLTSEKNLDRNCIKADCTVVFHAKKPVHLQSFAKVFCGEMIVMDIGIDEDTLWNVEI